MKKRFVLGVCVAGILFGAVGATADFLYGQAWHLLHNSFLVSLPILVAGLVGGAAGLWALVSLAVAYVLARKLEKPLIVAALNITFLMLAVTSYYMVAPALDTSQAWYSAATIMLWLVIAAAIGIIHGVAGSWLLGSAQQKSIVAILAAAYVVLDCTRLIEGAATNQLIPQAIVVSLFYVAIVGWFVWKVFRSR